MSGSHSGSPRSPWPHRRPSPPLGPDRTSFRAGQDTLMLNDVVRSATSRSCWMSAGIRSRLLLAGAAGIVVGLWAGPGDVEAGRFSGKRQADEASRASPGHLLGRPWGAPQLVPPESRGRSPDFEPSAAMREAFRPSRAFRSSSAFRSSPAMRATFRPSPIFRPSGAFRSSFAMQRDFRPSPTFRPSPAMRQLFANARRVPVRDGRSPSSIRWSGSLR